MLHPLMWYCIMHLGILVHAFLAIFERILSLLKVVRGNNRNSKWSIKNMLRNAISIRFSCINWMMLSHFLLATLAISAARAQCPDDDLNLLSYSDPSTWLNQEVLYLFLSIMTIFDNMILLSSFLGLELCSIWTFPCCLIPRLKSWAGFTSRTVAS